MSCYQSLNVVCKHQSASMVYYLDLDARLPSGVTIESVTATTEDAFLEVDMSEIVEEDITIPGGSSCAPKILSAGRAILIRLSGGQDSDDEVIVTTAWVQSDGNSDAVDCRILVGGGS